MANEKEGILIYEDPDAAHSLLKTAEQAALKAGKVLKSLFGRIKDIRHKGRIDLVTEADVASERVIIEVLKSTHPGIPVLSEETNPEYRSASKDDFFWIVDPLDGTTNFAHAFPWFGVSIALASGDKVILGIIHCPVQQETFSASLGKGAWLNGRPIKVSNTPTIEDALLATGFPYDVQEDAADVMAAFKAVVTKVQGVRRAGAAALDLAYVACGRFDGFWEIKLKPWDTAAGKLLVEEAGGKVTDFRGSVYSPFMQEIMATNGLIHRELGNILMPFSQHLKRGVTCMTA
ncbi:MAG: inositol monophosphatase family protein [Dissulfurimicrobium sp.]|uniref:inositol monophosphatase family protein n=1 Tax=Dissulfurimicrobium TaxID=1769732 RepID=UPI003C75B782